MTKSLKKTTLFAILLCFSSYLFGQQADRWQQKAEYKMEVELDVETHKVMGTQSLTYYNNSPDTLDRVFYHLFFNAFQPNSMMDVRSRTIMDPDRRVGDRISKLSEQEIGYQKIKSLKQNKKAVSFEEVGTILEVTLASPILPGSKAVFDMEFEAQVPLQIRRTGRNNQEGIDYTMTQWFPKMCEYDYMGWHANPYIGREFHQVWADFDVKITIDEKYTIGGTGYLQNAKEIGHGYAGITEKKKGKKGKHTWHFIAPNVLDFAFGADPDYVHTIKQVPNGPTLHFFYQPGEATNENWEQLPDYTVRLFQIANQKYGKYPYDQYSVIQGGDGGTEYSMCTMITGERTFGSLVGVTVHEAMHSWYQHVLAFNETKYAWMDEGFTSYASAIIMNELFEQNASNPMAGSYAGNKRLVQSEYFEAMSTHSDFYHSNGVYGANAYTRGAIFLHQLEYVVGKSVFDRALLRFFNTWKFRHPEPNDLIRIFEKESGMQLKWYLEQWVYSTNTIDYGIRMVEPSGSGATITIDKIGRSPMPLDVAVTTKDGQQTVYNIPMRIMRGTKSNDLYDKIVVKSDWPWVYPVYALEIDTNFGDIEKVQIDPSGRLADIENTNDTWPVPDEKKEIIFKD